MVPDQAMNSGHHMSDAGIFVRPCAESRGWVIRSLSSRKLVVFRNASVVRDPNTRHAQMALSGDLAGRQGVLGVSPGVYLLASHFGDPPSAPIIAGDPFTGVPIAHVPAIDADGDRISAPESAWPSPGVQNGDVASKSLGLLVNPLVCSLHGNCPPAVTQPGTHDLCSHEPDPAVLAPVRGTRALQSRPLGMPVRSAAVLRAFRSAEIMRRAVFPSDGDDAVLERRIDSRAAAAGGAGASPGGPSASGSGGHRRSGLACPGSGPHRWFALRPRWHGPHRQLKAAKPGAHQS